MPPLGRPELGGELPATTTLNDWLNHGRELPLRGGDMVVVDRVWTQVRKVRRRRITEAVLDPLGSPYDTDGKEKQLAFGLNAILPELAASALPAVLPQGDLPKDGSGPWIELIGKSGGAAEPSAR